MRHPIIVASLLMAIVAGPAAARAQDDGATQRGFIEQLCSVELDDEAGIATCLVSVGAVLAGASVLPPEAGPTAEPGGLLDRARRTAEDALASAQETLQGLDVKNTVDEAIAAARASAQDVVGDVDLQAALDEAVAQVQDVDLQAALDEAVTAAQEVDVEAALDDALTAAQAVDLQAALDDALARADEAVSAAQEVDLQALLGNGVETTRAVVAEAQAWITENADAVCTGSSLSAGTAAAAVVAYLTGSPGLAISAFERTESISKDVCGDVTEAAASPRKSPGPG